MSVTFKLPSPHPLPFNSPFRPPAPSMLIIIPQPPNHCYMKFG